LAILNYKKGEFESAENLCKKILSINSNHCETMFLLGLLSVRKKKLDSAKKLFTKITKIEIKNVKAYNNLGNVLREMGDNKNAEISFKKVIEIDPKNTNALYNIGGIYFSSKKYIDAKNYFEKTIKTQPNFAMAYFSLANVKVELKDLEGAVNSYNEAIKYNTNFSSSYNNLGLVYRNLNNFDKAIENYKKAIEIKPHRGGTHHNLGLAYKEIGEFDRAIDAHNMAIKYEPENLINYYYLSELNKSILNKDLKNKIKKILNKKNLQKRNIAYGNFLLAKYEQSDKKYEDEIKYLLIAHKNYFDSKLEKFKLGIKYCFEDLMQISKFANTEKNINHKNQILKPIFIIGVPRCGSTLVEKILASGENKIPMGEETAVFENFINEKIIHKQSLNLGDTKNLHESLYNIYDKKGLVSKENDYVFTDKSLNNFFYIPIIKNIFPKAKIIHCKRDLIASIVSILQNNLTELSWAHDLDNIFKYFNNYLDIMKNNKEKYNDMIYELDFEKLVDDPESESKKLMNYCNLKWDKQCLEFYKRKDLISKTASNIQIRKAIYKNSEKKYLPYKNILSKYGNKYSWFK